MLTAGARVGPYEVVEPLGTGGMGEVWRPRDPRLERHVGLNLLPDAFASHQARLSRFRREARMLPSPNHPGFCYVTDPTGVLSHSSDSKP